ncbi:MAG: hypothetical protein EA427_08895 [Spirochaetaceae bacterium]|nr:MAG: hypothetical protein EA427_08895 [Spirochaetaceae bacterium]
MHHLREGELIIDVQLRGEAHLKIPYPLVEVVPRKFSGDLFEVLRPLHDPRGETEPAQVLIQIGVFVLEDELVQTFRGVGGKIDFLLPGNIDERGLPETAVQMNMQVCFWNFSDELFRIASHTIIIILMRFITPYPLALLLAFLAGVPGLPAEPGGVSPEDSVPLVNLRIRSFPPEAELFLDGRALRPVRRDGSWREYRINPEDGPVELSAPGYRERPIHLMGASGVLELEERLLPRNGPLLLAGEFPTGASPKSVLFLPGNRLVVPLLRDRGAEVFRWSRGEGALRMEYLTTLSPGPDDGDVAFVEPLLLQRRGEVWISRMDPDELHRFDLRSLRWLERISPHGRWPKVMVPERAEERVYVANWLSESVSVIDASSGAVERTIAVGGQPRGMWLSPAGGFLWVCLFSTGDIEVIDLEQGEVVYRLGLPRGAARHIVASPDNRTLYYTDMYHGTVSMIDAERRVVTRTRRVGPNVNTLVPDPRGEFVFVSVRGRNNPADYLLPGPEHGRIVVLDARTLEEIQSIWARRQPTGLAVSPDGTLLAATDFLDDNLAVYEIRR